MISFTVKPVENSKAIINFIAKGHYSNFCPRSSKHVFGLFDGDKLIGACCIGPFVRLAAARKYKDCLELTRFYVIDDTPKNTESFFLSRCLKWMQQNTDIKGIISYADPNVGHVGTIYKAANFEILTYTSRSYHYLNKDNKRIHIRSVAERALKNRILEKNQAKRDGLRRIEDEQKIVYLYRLKDDLNIQIVSTYRKDYFEKNERRIAFFKTWTKESAWVYGLILGDGCIHQSEKSNRVLFFGNRPTMEAFCRLLELSKSKRKANGYEVYFDSKGVVEWFANRGICGKKNHIPWPEDLPEDLKPHFLRGLFDTDGTVTISKPKKGRNHLVLGYSSIVYSFIERVLHEIGCERSIVRSEKRVADKTYVCYSFGLNVVDSIMVSEHIYKDSEGIRNEERYKICQKGIELFNQTQETCAFCDKPIHTRDVCTEHMWEEIMDKREPRGLCKYGDGRPVYIIEEGICQSHYHQQRRQAKAEAEGRKTFTKSTFGVSREFGPQISVEGLVPKIKKKRVKKPLGNCSTPNCPNLIRHQKLKLCNRCYEIRHLTSSI